MNEKVDETGIPGYVSIKEAAKILGLSPITVYEYVAEGRLSSRRAAHVIMIPLEEVTSFKPNVSGRPRKSLPVWRLSHSDNELFMTSIEVRFRPHQQDLLEQRLASIKDAQTHLFPGTVARYITGNDADPEDIEIVFVWRSTIMPNEETRERALEDFRNALADILDWSTANYKHGKVFLHT